MAQHRIMAAFYLVAAASIISAVVGAPILQEPTTTFEVGEATYEPVVDGAENTYTNTPAVPTSIDTSQPITATSETAPVADFTPKPLLPPGYQPLGGLGVNSSNPVYQVTADYDRQSLILALYQKWAELDFLHQGFAAYSDELFEKVGLMATDRALLQHMADQEAGHASILTKLLGGTGPTRCTYNYPHQQVREYLDFGQKITRWGESLNYGFISHLESREAAQALMQSVATEARQQMIFRQYNGLHPMPVVFEAGIPQSWAWTFLAPYISHCDPDVERVVWQNFPKLTVINQPNPLRLEASKSWNDTYNDAVGTQNNNGISYNEACGQLCRPGIAHSRARPLSYAGRDVYLQWDSPGEPVGPDNSYSTSILAGTPLYAAWVSSTMVTYTPLLDIVGNTAHTYQPNATTYRGLSAVNGTMYIAITDAKPEVLPFNLDRINPHVIALGMYQAG
ncbi:ferritin-like domain-containing protein [Microdochium nivale]|nr:ferritin-like domain-containing protein [Microdochium nivale]